MSESSNAEERPMTEFVDSWSDVSKHVVNSYVEANRAILAGMGLSSSKSERINAPVDELSYGAVGWSMERSVDTREELGVGEYVEFTKPLTDADVHAFAQASGDTNRLHLDEEFAAGTRFGTRIVHGTLVGGLISAALARLPGLTIYLSESLEFKGPARIGSVLTARCEIVEDLGQDRYRLVAEVTEADGSTLIDGEAVVLIDEQPA
ncbi:MaoC family dehydratase [Halalkalicoccus jeotgali]|uniref:MaoC domain protein dehydratase n=1 Tax=Halalkalicoccus jeotgali (strain DSM 18796 / CECT 7217 / JCM 14584 / KCTC 4019 / B3) TaxID=795797 RepID=D8J5X9_HALJB|nr:MaoC family dehydratase [Halalkalicoccus jeotgali]ADJ13785.1 MaoC domain protein dehydratase [Halalkalicoccus jeotgali B3]ELY34169.1 MaoC domain-containing protein dehydratase [Halalkalicoccus jeotgali B3]